jgi:hypothetical protein
MRLNFVNRSNEIITRHGNKRCARIMRQGGVIPQTSRSPALLRCWEIEPRATDGRDPPANGETLTAKIAGGRLPVALARRSLPKWVGNPIPPEAQVLSKIRSRILGRISGEFWACKQLSHKF